MPITHYQILGLPQDAAESDIRRAFRREALLWHPDQNPGDLKAHHRFIAIRAAYDVLSDPLRRARYDDLLRMRAVGLQWAHRDSSPPSRPERRRPAWDGGVSGGIILLLWCILHVVFSDSCHAERQPGWEGTSGTLVVVSDSTDHERIAKMALDSSIRALLRASDSQQSGR